MKFLVVKLVLLCAVCLGASPLFASEVVDDDLSSEDALRSDGVGRFHRSVYVRIGKAGNVEDERSARAQLRMALRYCTGNGAALSPSASGC